MDERIKRIVDSVPKKMFFDPSFEGPSRNGLLADVELRKGKTLTREQEYQVFRKYNYLKYRLIKMTVGFKETEETPAPKPCPPASVRRLGEKSILELENLVARITEIRNFILQANTRLIFRPVGRHFPSESFERDELVSNSYLHVIKAIDCFDYRRGFKFSTYCVNALNMNLLRDVEKIRKIQSRTEPSDSLSHISKPDDSYLVQESERYTSDMVEKVFAKVRENFHNPEREIEVLKDYYGIGRPSMLAREIGKKMNLSRARICQIKIRAESFVAANLSYDP